MEVADGADGVAPHHPELVDVPVGEVRLVKDGHLGRIGGWGEGRRWNKED